MREGIQVELPDENVRKYGCYALCLLHWAEHDLGETFSDDRIRQLLNLAYVQGWMDADCYVREPAKIYNRARGVDLYKSAKLVYDRTAIEAFPAYIICNYKKTAAAAYRHFTAMVGGALFDPLPPDRPAAAGYRVESFRILV